MSKGNRCLEEFKIGDLIKEGAFGKVYKSHDLSFDREVAIKVVDFYSGEQEKTNVEILKEITIPFVVKFYGYFARDKLLYIIMEHCSHGDLRSVVKTHISSNTRIEDEIIKQWSRELMLVLIFMQEKNIVHNDIKPENILLNESNNSIIVADVGEAQLANKYQSITKRGGTEIYMAPERILSYGRCSSTASDVWSCGIVFYEMVYLKLPFDDLLQFKTNPKIGHESTKIGDLYKPIFEGIFIESPKERLTPQEILTLIIGASINKEKAETLTPDELQLAKLLKLVKMKSAKIQDHYPKIVTENYINLMDLSLIDDAFKQSNILMLTGIAGAGKSTLATEYAKRFSGREGSVVVWFNAETVSHIDERLQCIIIDDLEFDKEKVRTLDDEQRIGVVTKHIRVEKTPHLFVFDNIEETGMSMVKLFSDSIPGNLKIILTSRNGSLKANSKIEMNVLQLNPITSLQAKEYLIDRMSDKLRKQTVEEIYERVIQADNQLTPFYLQSVVASLEMHIDQHGGIESSQLNPLINELKSVDISDYLLSNVQGNGCRQVLDVVQYLDPDEISFYVLKLLITPKESIQQGLAALKKYQIVTEFFIDDAKFIKIHRLIIKSIKNDKKRNLAEQKAIRDRIVTSFLKDLESIDTVNQENIVLVKRLQKHVLKMLDEKLEANMDVFKLYKKFILIEEDYNYNFKSSINKSHELLSVMKGYYTKQPNNAHIAIYCLEDLASTYKTIGNYSEAIKLNKEAMDMKFKIYKNQPDHPDIALSLNHQAIYYENMGNYEEALKLGEKSLKMRRRIHKNQPDHNDIAMSLNNLASVHKQLGNHLKAIKFYQESLDINRRIRKDQPDNPVVAICLNNLASAYESIGNYAEAIKLYEESLKMSRKIYKDKPDHPEIATSLNNLSDLHFKTGKYVQAIEYQKAAMDIRRRIYKDQPDHPYFASGLRILSRAHMETGNNQEGIKLAKEALEIMRRIYQDQPSHPEIAYSLNILGEAFYKEANFDDAIELTEEALEIFRKIYKGEPNHIDIANCLNNLAAYHEAQGDFTKSIELNLQALEMKRKFYKDQPEHSSIAQSLNNLAGSYQSIENYSEAIKLLNEALDLKYKFFKDQPYHHEIAASLNNLAWAYEKSGNYLEALKYFKRSLETWKKAFKDFPEHDLIEFASENVARLEEIVENMKTAESI